MSSQKWGEMAGAEVAHQPMHLLLGGLVAGGGVVAREAGKILAEAVPGREAVVGARVEVAQRRPAIPAAHVFSGRGQAGPLAKGLQQRVLVERGIEGVIGVELLAARAFEQFHIPVAELPKRRPVRAISPGRVHGERRGGGERARGFQEFPA